jgi:hypothetical protein
MELDDIRRQALAAREFQKVIEHVTFTLRLPTRYEVTLAARRSAARGATLDGSTDNDPAHLLILERLLLEQAVVRWSGLRLRNVLPDEATDEDITHSSGAVPLLLDAQPDWARELGVALFDRMAQRRERQDTAAKN